MTTIHSKSIYASVMRHDGRPLPTDSAATAMDQGFCMAADWIDTCCRAPKPQNPYADDSPLSSAWQAGFNSTVIAEDCSGRDVPRAIEEEADRIRATTLPRVATP